MNTEKLGELVGAALLAATTTAALFIATTAAVAFALWSSDPFMKVMEPTPLRMLAVAWVFFTAAHYMKAQDGKK